MSISTFPVVHESRAFVASLIPDVMNLAGKLVYKDMFHNHELADAFRGPQIDSKSSLLNEIVGLGLPQNTKILVIGGWLGFTSYCLFKLGFFDITEIDMDPRVKDFSLKLNTHNTNFKYQTTDCNLVDTSVYDIVINTCCEHILDNTWFDKITEKTAIFLHSNDLTGYGHVNTCIDLEDMKHKYPMTRFWTQTFSYPGWSRYTLSGYK